MNKNTLMKRLITFLAVLITASTSIGQTLINGDFESWPSGCPYNVAPDGWTNFSTSLGPDQAGSCAGTVTSHQGSSHMNLVWYSVNGLNEGAIQTITGLTAGASYEINFYAINDQGLYSYGDPAFLDVYLDNAVIYSTPELISGGNWTSYTVLFIASATTHSIGFKVRDGSTGTSGSVGVDAVSINGSQSSNNLLLENKFEIYPNPFNNELTVTIPEQTFSDASISIHNTLGQTVFDKQYFKNESKKTIDMKMLPGGIYFIDLMVDGKISIRKIVKI